MNNRDKTIAFFREEKTNFIPVTAYYHFGQQHLNGIIHSQLQIEFYKKFKPNILKVMNDYSFILPSTFKKDDFNCFHKLLDTTPVVQYPEQLVALENIVHQLHNEVVIIDTLFNPWFTIKRHILFNEIDVFMEKYSKPLHNLLSYVTDCLLDYIKRSITTGIDGVLYSVPASQKYLTKECYLEFMKPYDDKIMSALDNTKLITIVHIHGHGNIYYDDIISNKRMSGLSWSDKNTNLSLDKAKLLTSTALMAGINENKEFNYIPYRELEKEIDDALNLTKGHKFILSPGCVLTPQCPTERLMHYFDYSQKKISELSLVAT